MNLNFPNLVYGGMKYVPDHDMYPYTASYSNIDQGSSFAHINVPQLTDQLPAGLDNYEAWVVLDTPKGRFVSDWHYVKEWNNPSLYSNLSMSGSFYDLQGKKIETADYIRQENGVYYIAHEFGNSITVNYDKATVYAVKDDAMYQQWHDQTITG